MDPELRAELNRAGVRALRWRQRHLPEPLDGRRCIPVRLCDVPLTIRLEAAHRVNRHEDDQEQRYLVLHAALFPSDDIHWIAA